MKTKGATTKRQELEPLRALEEGLKKCVKCGSCRDGCPAFGAFCREPASARGKLALARHLLEENIALDDKSRMAMSKCLLCGNCVEKCPNGAPIDEIIIATREALANNLGPSAFHSTFGRIIKSRLLMSGGARAVSFFESVIFKKIPATSGLRLRFPAPFIGNKRHIPSIARKPFMARYPEVVSGQPGKPKILFFTGCMINFIYPQLAEAALTLFQNLGCTVIIPKDQQCCGLPALSGGDMDTACWLAEKNLLEMERFEFDYAVNACASCGATFHRFYSGLIAERMPELKERLKNAAERMLDVSRALRELGLDPAETATGNDVSVTYHDPCHLRNSGLSSAPRELLRLVPGVKLLEMDCPESCCGLGGTFSVYHYGPSMDINEVKTAAILNTGAQLVATGCPGCMTQLSDGLKHSGSSIRVAHTLELLAGKLIS